MKRYSSRVVLVLLSFLLTANTYAKQSQDTIVAGWLETVILAPWQIQLRAKLDTGAKTSSIHAENIERFVRDDKEWIRFSLPTGKASNAIPNSIETPLVRDVLIKRHNLDSIKRPVVELSFCINSHYYKSEFSLADRHNYNYPLLLGRRFLENNIIVDSAATFMHSKKILGTVCNEIVALNVDNTNLLGEDSEKAQRRKN